MSKRKDYTIETHMRYKRYVDGLIDELFSPYDYTDQGIKVNLAVWDGTFTQVANVEKNKKKIQREYDDASIFFKKWVKACSEELILQMMNNNKNRYKEIEMDYLILASILLACKTIMGENMGFYVQDFLRDEVKSEFPKMKNKKIVENIERMEMKLYASTDYNSCRAAMRKMYKK